VSYLSRNGGAFGANKNSRTYPRRIETEQRQYVGCCPDCGGPLYADGYGGAQCDDCGEVWDPWEVRS